jgi:DNA polymerase III delta prime subunit
MGNGGSVKNLTNWINNWESIWNSSTSKPGKNAKRAALLSGPPGIGKTTTATLVAEACNRQVIEKVSVGGLARKRDRGKRRRESRELGTNPLRPPPLPSTPFSSQNASDARGKKALEASMGDILGSQVLR